MQKQQVFVRLLKYTALTGAFIYLLIYVSIACARMAYPFGLEWMEGGSLEHVRRILAGQRLYVQPTLNFVPYIYPPLYFYLSALISIFTSSGFFPLRLLSFLASLGTLTSIFLFVRYETDKDLSSAFLATGLFAATFHLSGDWFDIARVDSLCLSLSILGVYLLRAFPAPSGKICTGCCLALAFLTKQTALVIAAPVLAYDAYAERRRALWAILPFLTLAGSATLLLDYAHDGWYRYYVFSLPGQHEIFPRLLIRFWNEEIILPLALCVCLVLCFLWRHWRHSSKTTLFFIAFGVGALGSSWISRGHSGSYTNVLLPAYSFLAILFGLAMHHFLHEEHHRTPETRIQVAALLYLVCILQFCALLYDPFQAIPTQADREAGLRVLDRIRHIEGDVFIPRHGYLAALAGKKSFAQEMAITDVLRSVKGGERLQHARQSLKDELQSSIEQQRFGAVIGDYEQGGGITEFYEKSSVLFRDRSVFLPVTGNETRPQYLYAPKQ